MKQLNRIFCILLASVATSAHAIIVPCGGSITVSLGSGLDAKYTCKCTSGQSGCEYIKGADGLQPKGAIGIKNSTFVEPITPKNRVH